MPECGKVHLSRYLLLSTGRNSTKLATSLFLRVRVCESNIFFFLCSILPFVHRPFICPSRYLLLNNWAEFNQTCYITFPHGKGKRELNYIIVHPSFRVSIVRASVRHPYSHWADQPNLLHDFPSW